MASKPPVKAAAPKPKKPRRDGPVDRLLGLQHAQLYADEWGVSNAWMGVTVRSLLGLKNKNPN
jgi:hypothetical protein